MLLRKLLLVFVVFLCAIGVANANLIKNSGFEQGGGGFFDWGYSGGVGTPETVNLDYVDINPDTGDNWAQIGYTAAATSPIDFNGIAYTGRIYQNLTNVLTPGIYDVSFSYNLVDFDGDANDADEFKVLLYTYGGEWRI
jgi:hypothetical protein